MYHDPFLRFGFRFLILRASRLTLWGCLGTFLLSPGSSLGSSLQQSGWPEFRGPYGNGLAHLSEAPADGPGFPLHWSETENVVWKTAIPFEGWSTPVVLAGQVWVTTATEDGHEFYAICLDAETGQVVHHLHLFHSDNPDPLGNNVNCYASPSPVIEPGRLYVHFGSYGTACLDTDSGDVLWRREDLNCRHYRGPGSSPILFEELLILTFDGVDVQYVTALDKKTGSTVWKTDRSNDFDDLDAEGNPFMDGDMRKAFSTPLIIGSGNDLQMISPGSKATFSYNPRTGSEIWSTHHKGYSTSARAVFDPPLAFVTTGFGKSELHAIRVDGHGDVTASHVAWKWGSRDVPNMPSPIVSDDLLFLVSNNGMGTCLDASTGEPVWRERIGGSHIASPILAGGRIYFFNTRGETKVVKPGRTYQELATNRLEEGFLSSPSVSGRALFLRTRTHLYRIESPSPSND